MRDNRFFSSKNFIIVTYAITYSAIMILCLTNLKDVMSFLSKVFGTFTPLFYAVAIAFVLNLLMVRIERLMDKVKSFANKKKFKRGMSVALTFVISITSIVLVLVLIVPEITNSISILIDSIPGYFDNMRAAMLRLVDYLGADKIVDGLSSLPWEQLAKNFLTFVSGLFSQLFSSTANITVAITSTIGNLVLGLIMSIYILYSKEILILQVKKISYSFLNIKIYNMFKTVVLQFNKTMSGFIVGQLTEAVILGVLCFIGMSILNMPYSPLISVIIGVTNVIPYFGPVIGTIPSAFILLMYDPLSALIFIGFILILQQVDANIIYPKIVGESVELPALWIMLSILAGGGIFGIIGMILGVPIFAVFYSLFGKFVNKRYSAKIGENK